MNDMNDYNQTSEANVGAEQKPAAFCQNCGKPLTRDAMRAVGQAIYCEPCLMQRLAGAPPARPTAAPGYGPVQAGSATFGIPISTDEPNPGLAALLGLIPGVGAMYNEQYAKGLVHLVIFAVLVTFAHVTEIFILFVFGWEFYMAIEAHHTAKARRDGTPLPNPFGFNDIGERMGFGKNWPQATNVAEAARDAANAAAAGLGTATGGFGSRSAGVPPVPGVAYGTVPPVAPPVDPNWGAPVDGYNSSTAYAPPYGQGYAAPYVSNPTQPYGYGSAVPPYGPHAPAMPPSAAYVPPIVLPSNRFPAGAVWLIGLGTVFLLGTTGLFRGFPGVALVGFVLLGLGVWIFLRRMTATGEGIAYDGTQAYQHRVIRALRGSAWLVVLGILSLLDTFGLVRWHNSWPWLLILFGLMALLQRSVYNASIEAQMYPSETVPPITHPSASVVPPTVSESDSTSQGGN